MVKQHTTVNFGARGLHFYNKFYWPHAVRRIVALALMAVPRENRSSVDAEALRQKVIK